MPSILGALRACARAVDARARVGAAAAAGCARHQRERRRRAPAQDGTKLDTERRPLYNRRAMALVDRLAELVSFDTQNPEGEERAAVPDGWPPS